MSSLPDITVGADARGPLFELNARGHEVASIVTAVASAAADLASSAKDHDDTAPVVWVDHPDGAVGNLDSAMAAAGYASQRDLWKMEVELPLDTSTDITTRSFRVGVDEPRWVEVNNRAFSWHREQGGWTVDEVIEREHDDWFDADGFLIHDVDGDLAGFCWTKIHDDETPPAGEIYVIGVDPDHHGKGLGRAMTMAGLQSINARGYTRGILYVDADNAPAVGLYRSMGFTIDTVRRLYARPDVDG